MAVDGESEDAIQSIILHLEIEIRPLHATKNHDTLTLNVYAVDEICEIGNQSLRMPSKQMNVKRWS